MKPNEIKITENHEQEETVLYQREYKDRLFKAIFGRDTEQSKRWRLQLYNALNNTNYTDPEALELNTIENVIYITMHNDISFLVDSQMNLYEQQSTYNPNMPLRGLMYFSQLYQIHLTKEGKNLLSSRLVQIPTPKFVVFYIGSEDEPDSWKIKLSEAFIRPDNSGDFEWTATIININEKKNPGLQKKCNPLYDYVSYVSRILNNMKSGMRKKTSIEEAINFAIENNYLEGFFRTQKAEVMAMSLTEFDEEEVHRIWREDGYEDGIADGEQKKAIEDAVILINDFNISPEVAAEKLGAPLDKVLDALKKINA